MKTIAVIWFVLFLFAVGGAEAKHYKGGELRTTASYLYGRFETQQKASPGSGQLCSFFTYHEIEYASEWNEIDIEILGRYEQDVQFNTITPGRVDHVSHQYVDFNPSRDFHTYGFEWTPDYVAWFIDGAEVLRQTGDHVSTLDKEQKIMMNIWNPTYESWTGRWDDRILPVFACYDWVRYASYTPGKGDTGSEMNFTHQWTDHFDSLDSTRWEKATHTFLGNQCDFLPENIVFQDGLMILCLTDENNTGYVDRTPPAFLWARAGQNRITILFSEEVERQSAETISNYFVIPGITVDEVALGSDNRSVKLGVNGIELDQEYKLVVQNIRDRAPTPNILGTQAEDIIMPVEMLFPVFINVGGDSVDGFLPDLEWSEEVEYGFMDGVVPANPPDQPISGTNYQTVYQSERHGQVLYRVRVPVGLYAVTLMMAETYFEEAGRRVFDVYIEGKKVTDDLDLFQRAGMNTAVEETIHDVEVTDGILEIQFSASVDRPLLNGLMIEQRVCPGRPGDVNGDGRIDVMDVVVTINHLLGRRPLDACGIIRADSDGDLEIQVTDVLNLVNVITRR